MTENELSIDLSRILSGYYYIYVNDHRYKIQYPSVQVKYEADLIAQQESDRIKYAGWYTRETINHILMELDLWTPFDDKRLKSLENSLEDYKVDLYKNNRNTKKIKELKRTIQATKKTIAKLQNLKYSYDHITIEGHCESVKNNFYLINSVYDEYGRLCLSENSDMMFFVKIKEAINKNHIDVHRFRSIARSDAWRSYWSASGEQSIFNGPIVSWTDEQKTLVVISKMYDGARESMDSPEEHIYEDDDMFDGWIITQRRESEKQKNKNRIEKGIGDKHQKAGEVFVVANSKQDIEDIYNINDEQSKAIIKERQNFLQNSKLDKITEAQLPDVRRDIIIKSNQLRSGKGK
jgi:hypothetical protein